MKSYRNLLIDLAIKEGLTKLEAYTKTNAELEMYLGRV